MLLALLWVGLLPLFGQIPDLIFSNISIYEGLPQNTVLDISQDSLGFTWFATPRYLSRYDGSEFKIFDKTFDNIQDAEGFRIGQILVNDPYLWLISEGGKLDVLNLRTEKFKRVSHFGGVSPKALPIIRTLFIENSKRIWLGTEGEGMYLVNQDFEVINHYHKDAMPALKLISNQINKIVKDSAGNIWVLTNLGLNRVSHSGMFTYLNGINVTAMAEISEKGRYYIGTYGQGMHIYDSKTDKVNNIFTRRPYEIPSDLFVTDLLVDKDFMLWIGTRGNGIYIFDGFFSEAKQFFSKRNAISAVSNSNVHALFLNQREEVYFGTDGGGVGIFDPYRINFKNLIGDLGSVEMPEESTTAIAQDTNGHLWFGTMGRKFVSYSVHEKVATVYDLKAFLPEISNQERVNALQFDAEGDLWLGTFGKGLVVLDMRKGSLVEFGNKIDAFKKLPPKEISSLLFQDSTTFWTGSSQGLFLFDKYAGILKYFDSLPEDKILSLLHIDQETLAIGYARSGIYKLDKSSGIAIPILTDKDVPLLYSTPINSLYYLNGWLWAATTGKGIIAINIKSGLKKQFTTKEGLQDNYVFGIAAENSRTIWLSTGKGIIRLIYKKDNDDLTIDKLSFYNRQNGLLNNEFTPGSFLSGSDGEIYFGGTNGISHFRPDQIEYKNNPVRMVISEARINHQPLEMDQNVAYLSNIELDHRQNSVELKFIGLNSNAPLSLNYSYKLIGYDDDWVEAGNRNYAVYTNLNPGAYTFLVKLANNDLEAIPNTSLGILIRTPYWETKWFRTLVILVVMVMMFVLYKIRIYHLLQLQKIKDNISADLHDDLGARLTGIQMIWTVTRAKLGFQKELVDILQHIDEEIHASTEALDEIVGNMRLNDESLTDLVAKTRRYFSELLEINNIEYHINTDVDFSDRLLSMQKRRDFFLICKELLNNIIKHAKATHVSFSVTEQKNCLVIFIEDNGKGFDTTFQQKRYGLSIIQGRVRKWKGTIRLNSEIGKGTSVSIKIPFENQNLGQKILRLFKT